MNNSTKFMSAKKMSIKGTLAQLNEIPNVQVTFDDNDDCYDITVEGFGLIGHNYINRWIPEIFEEFATDDAIKNFCISTYNEKIESWNEMLPPLITAAFFKQKVATTRK